MRLPPVFRGLGFMDTCDAPRPRCGPARKAGSEHPRHGQTRPVPLWGTTSTPAHPKMPRQPRQTQPIHHGGSQCHPHRTIALRSTGVDGRLGQSHVPGSSSVAARCSHPASAAGGDISQTQTSRTHSSRPGWASGGHRSDCSHRRIGRRQSACVLSWRSRSEDRSRSTPRQLRWQAVSHLWSRLTSPPNFR
mgnify:CR=1 FL=1